MEQLEEQDSNRPAGCRNVKRQKLEIGDSIGSHTMSKEDEIASILEECLSTFRSLLQDIKIDDLVFCEPSKDLDDLHTPGSPPLHSLATTNTQFLQYQDSIKKLSLGVEKLDCEGFERCSNIKCQLLDDLQNEWTRLEELKRRAWQLTSRDTSLTTPPCSRAGPGLVQGIDTCAYQSDPMSCKL